MSVTRQRKHPEATYVEGIATIYGRAGHARMQTSRISEGAPIQTAG
jgi:hypothetical protein